MTYFLRSFCVWLIAIVVLCGLCSPLLYGQSTVDGAIGGTISDQHKAVIPNAVVSVRNVETNKEDKATADDSGGYRISQLRPGIYTLTVDAQGFAPYKRENVVVEIGRVTPLDITLAVAGEQSESDGD